MAIRGKCELSVGEVPQFLELWHLLEKGAAHFGFSIHRFNLAFDRGLLADRLVDLVIAAESLFLGDIKAQDRGELRFRFALRAAKFIKHPSYSEHDIFRVMRQAYDIRSAIVHGGSPKAKDTRLPDNPSATLPNFIDVIEELVRLGLRKGLSMEEDGKKIRQAEYWDTRILEAQLAATDALAHNADIAKVQEWLTHANTATTRLYDRRQSSRRRVQPLRWNAERAKEK